MPMPAAIASPGPLNLVTTSSTRISPSSGAYSPYSTFIRVLLPAPFELHCDDLSSPSTTAVNTKALSQGMGRGGRARHRARPPLFTAELAYLLRLRRRRDRDLAAFDVGLHLLDLCLHARRNLRGEVVVRRKAGAVVRQGADVASATERLARREVIRVRGNCTREALDHTGQEHRTVSRVADATVGVDPDDADLATRGLGSNRRAEASATGNREDDVSTLRDERLADRLATRGVTERVRRARVEGAALLLRLVPAEHLHRLALDLVEVLHALPEAIHVDGDRRDVQTTVGRNNARLRDGGREVPTEETALRGVELHAVDVRAGRRVVDLGELLLRVRRRCCLNCVVHQTADSDDRRAALLNFCVEVRRVVVLGVRRDVGCLLYTSDAADDLLCVDL